MRLADGRHRASPFQKRRRPATGNARSKVSWEEARKVLDEKGWNVSATARHFGVDESSVRAWITRNYAEKTLTKKRGRRPRRKVRQLEYVRALLEVHSFGKVAELLHWTPAQIAYVRGLGLDKNDKTK